MVETRNYTETNADAWKQQENYADKAQSLKPVTSQSPKGKKRKSVSDKQYEGAPERDANTSPPTWKKAKKSTKSNNETSNENQPKPASQPPT